MPSWDLYRMSPAQFDERLAWATTIVFGDVETQSLQLDPSFFADQFNPNRYVTYPDRFDLIKQWIHAGGHFHMNGGWFSFSGHQGYRSLGTQLMAEGYARPHPPRRLPGRRRPDRIHSLFPRANQEPETPRGAGNRLVDRPAIAGLQRDQTFTGREGHCGDPQRQPMVSAARGTNGRTRANDRLDHRRQPALGGELYEVGPVQSVLAATVRAVVGPVRHRSLENCIFSLTSSPSKIPSCFRLNSQRARTPQ